MFDEVFGEVENDFGYVAKKKLFFFGEEQEIDVHIDIDVDEGGEDLEDNGVAVLIEDGEVSEVGYKYIAY